MADRAWKTVEAELDAAARDYEPIRVWLRDDDAVEVTPALERLSAVCVGSGMPVLLAVIPAGATPGLAAWIGRTPAFTPCQHGFAHLNHAPTGMKACELGGDRALDAVAAELLQGRARLLDLFGERLSACLVPPWNRIAQDLIPRLPSLGYDRLSVFGPPAIQSRIRVTNTDLDIIDWRNGRVGRPLGEVARKLAVLIAASRASGGPIGLLTHHLAHDETAWGVLDEVLKRLHRHPAISFVDIAALV